MIESLVNLISKGYFYSLIIRAGEALDANGTANASPLQTLICRVFCVVSFD
jgi:hypothetical protein